MEEAAMHRGWKQDIRDWCADAGRLYLVVVALVSVVLGICYISDQCAIGRAETPSAGSGSVASEEDTLRAVWSSTVRSED
jgi:hypothetical protein